MAEQTRGWKREVAEYAIIIAVVLIGRAALAEARYIPSGSMEPTLLIGDEIVSTKWAYGYSMASLPFVTVHDGAKRIFGRLPKRGDVVTFRWPGDGSEVWVKRVIGLPGDHIQMIAGVLHINGQAVGLTRLSDGAVEADDGGAIPAMRFIETLPGGVTHHIDQFSMNGEYSDTADVLVPAGYLFVMGDDRDYSADSRVPVDQGGVGLLPQGNLIGRVDWILGSWNFAAPGGIEEKLKGVRFGRFFSSVKGG
jgi:signal peptidase I